MISPVTKERLDEEGFLVWNFLGINMLHGVASRFRPGLRSG